MQASQRHILAVNDSHEILDIFQELVAEADYRVTTRRPMLTEMEAIRADVPDLIVLDVPWAGDAACWSMLESIRTDRLMATTPIVLCAGGGGDQRSVMELGDRLIEQDTRVVLEPFDIDDLLGVVAEALGIPEAGIGGVPPRRILLVTGDHAPWAERALAAAGMIVATTSLTAGVGQRALVANPDVIVVVYGVAERLRAWNALTALKGSRALRTLPVILVTDDAEHVRRFRTHLDRLGITVLVAPDDAAIVGAVRRAPAG